MTWINLGAPARGGGFFASIAELLGFTPSAKLGPSLACVTFVSTMSDLGGFISDTDDLVDTHHDELWEAVDRGFVSMGSAWDTGYWLTPRGQALAKSNGPAV